MVESLQGRTTRSLKLEIWNFSEDQNKLTAGLLHDAAWTVGVWSFEIEDENEDDDEDEKAAPPSPEASTFVGLRRDESARQAEKRKAA